MGTNQRRVPDDRPAPRSLRVVDGLLVVIITLVVWGAAPAAASDLEDAWFVDVRNGDTRPLPRSIRSIPGLGRLAVSPHGTRIAVDGVDGIYVAKIDGSHRRVVGADLGASGPGWAPDGRTLTYTDGRVIYVVRVESGRERVVTFSKDWVLYPNFSPDGRTILFTKVAPGGPELWTVPASGGRSRLLLRLTAPHTNAAFGTYSPDGMIAYRRTQFDGSDVTHMTEGSVWIAASDGTHRRPLTHAASWMSQIDPERLWPTWSPAGRSIAYERLYETGIVVMDARSKRVVAKIEGIDPTWVDERTLIVTGYGRGSS